MGSLLSIIYQDNQTNSIIEGIEVKETMESDGIYNAVNISAKEKSSHNSSDNKQNLVVDAVETKFYENSLKMTVETVRDIEQNLDFYEKVSLVFLLYDQADIALNTLLIKQGKITSNTSIIYEWAKAEHLANKLWKYKFIEALAVIQRYDILQRLGNNKHDINNMYLPTQPYTSIYLNIIRKALYILCEELTKDDIKRFLNALKVDFNENQLTFIKYDETYVEIYFLHCFSLEYITNNNLNNIIRILKQINLVVKAEMLETIMSKVVDSTNSSNGLNMPNNNCNFEINSKIENYKNNILPPLCSDNSVIEDNSILQLNSSDDFYKIDPENVGICLIINQRTFYKDSVDVSKLPISESLEYIEVSRRDLEERHGTDVDRDKLLKTFTKLGFRVIVEENLRHTEILKKIEETLTKFSPKDSCFFLCILSHGIEKKIYASNSIPIRIKQIKELLYDRRFENLLGKPKVLIIQSCQGTDVQKVYFKPEETLVTDGPSNSGNNLNIVSSPSGVPEKCDLLVCMSTVSGFASIRNTLTGTWYIQELCETIEEECDKNDFYNILTIVVKKVSGKRFNKDGLYVTMVPKFSSTFSGKKLKLPRVKK